VQGEEMVKKMIEVSPLFSQRFQQVFPVQLQEEVAASQFKLIAKQQQTNTQCVPLDPLVKKGLLEASDDDIQKVKAKPLTYFQTKRHFKNLVPAKYFRTQAPRISTKGNTFHGMKKNLLISIANQLTCQSSAVLIDVDMSAAHTRVARYLLSDDESSLSKSLTDTEFWPTIVNQYRDRFTGLKELKIKDKEIKKFLKVGLYTSMNGGNPVNDVRLVANIGLNLSGCFQRLKINKESEILDTALAKVVRQTLQDFPLIQEVRSLSNTCYIKSDTTGTNDKNLYKNYTVDSSTAYCFEGQHKGISRVLQGFEVVLLSAVVYRSLEVGATPISLDHDGCLVMISKKKFAEYDNDPFKFAKAIESGIFNTFSNYLLDQSIPIEPKRLFIDGKDFEY